MNNATKHTLFVCKLLGEYITLWTLLISETVSSKSRMLKPPTPAFFSWAHRLHFQLPVVRYSQVTKLWSMECGQSDVCLFLIQTLPLRSLCIPPHLPFSLHLLAEWEGRRISILELYGWRILGPAWPRGSVLCLVLANVNLLLLQLICYHQWKPRTPNPSLTR